jgi:hypothetical protein
LKTGLLKLMLLVIGLAVAQGCSAGPEPVTIGDPRVKDLLSVMERVDRAARGFTPVNGGAKIRLEGKGGVYDATLHVYRFIRYSGPDSTITWPRELTLAKVRPMLEAWKTAPAEPQPPDLPDGDFDPGLALFALVMLFMFLLACLLALLLGGLVTLLIAALLTAGIISASVLTGILRRSVSSGFRALFLQVGAVVGVIAGGIGALVFIWLAKLPAASTQPWIIGPLVGLTVGLLAACLFNFAWGRSVDWIASKLSRRKSEAPERARV